VISAGLSRLAGLVSVADDIRELRGPIAVPVPAAWWPYLVAAGALVAIAVAIRAYRQRRRRPPPPHRHALRVLEAARAEIDRGDVNRFALQVSDAVRGYVEAAFALHAPRLTTEELLAELMSDDSPVAAHRAELGTFLEQIDLAKYARWPLSRSEMTRMIESAQRFVRATANPVRGAS
jgi:hypothetical protein